MSDVPSSTPQGPDQPRSGQPGQAGPPPPPPPFGQTPFGQQPAVGPPYQQPGAGPPPNYLVWAILSTLFCCLPLGIVSIVFAAQVNAKYSAGDVTGAQVSSKKARQFAIWAAIAGVIVGVIYLVAAIAANGS